jgi:thiol-disulfide isomerase/thioredoxin
VVVAVRSGLGNRTLERALFAVFSRGREVSAAAEKGAERGERDVADMKIAALCAVTVAFGLAGCGSSAKSSSGTATGVHSTTVGRSCSVPSSACGSSQTTTLAVGKPAPALTGAALDGSGHVSLDELRGKPTVVVLWSPPCPHCEEEMPKIQALATRLASKANFMSAAIERPDLRATPGYETAAKAAATMNLAMPSVAITRADADAIWHAQSLPTAYLLDKDHRVIEVIQGADPKTIESGLVSKLGVS